MATWPTVSDIKGAYAKLNNSQLDAKIGLNRTRAINRIKTRMSVLFDITGWDTAAPPALIDLVYPMAYGWTALSTHPGASQSGSDDTGKKALDDALEQLERYALGNEPILDGSDAIISPVALSDGVQILTEPIFGMKSPPQYQISQVSTAPYGLPLA